MLNPRRCGGSEAGDRQAVSSLTPEGSGIVLSSPPAPSDPGFPRHLPSPEKEFPELGREWGRDRANSGVLGSPPG